MKINQIVKQYGITRKAIIYYEQEGLIEPSRLDNGYREFKEKEIVLLEKIHKLRLLGVPVKVIKNYLENENVEILNSYLIEERTGSELKQSQLTNLEGFINQGTELPYLVTECIRVNIPGLFGEYVASHFSYFLTKDKVNYFENKEIVNQVFDYIDKCDFSEIEEILGTDDRVKLSYQFHSKHYKMVSNMEELKLPNREELTSAKKDKSIELIALTGKLQEKLIELNYYTELVPLIRKLSPSYNLYAYKLEHMGKIHAEKQDS